MIAEVGYLIVTVVLLLWLAGRLMSKIKDTLHLFCKISKKDIQRYRNHFENLKQQFKDGHTMASIVDVQRRVKEDSPPLL